MECKLTYFTPTYNREKLLPKLYECLANQTNNNFSWLIVDDGSVDNTKHLVRTWQKEKKVNIEYIFKENGGKNSAMEVAFAKCNTEFICIVDSDDFLTEDATDIIYNYMEFCDDSIAGIVGRRAHYDKTPFNNSWCEKCESLYFKELSTQYNYNEDTCLVFKTKIVKNYHFPKIQGEKFITESVFYNQFMHDYKLLAIPECIYLAEYQEVGYTSQGINLFFKNPRGYLYALKQNFYYDLKSKKSLKHILFDVAYFYAWKSVLKIKDDFKFDYKIKFPYNFVGWCLQIILIPKLKKKYKMFLKSQKGGN